MKKLSRKYKRWLLNRASRQLAKRRKANGNSRIAIISIQDGARPIRLRGPGAFAVPRVLCFDQNLDKTLTFFGANRRRAALLTRGMRVLPVSQKRSKIATLTNYLDFEQLEYVSAGAALVLAAEHDRASRMTGVRPATINLSQWNPYVATTLSRLGFFKLLRLADYKDQPQDAILLEPMVSESDTDIRPGSAAIRNLFSRIGGSNSQLRVDLGSALTDAVENVVNHAYPLDWDERKARLPLWWFVGAADIARTSVTLIIYDQGITIPASLPRRWSTADIIAAWQRRFGLPFRDGVEFDGEAIDAAMMIGATSTSASYRGKGLAKIRDVVTKCQHGRLRIIGRHGACLYRAGYEPVISFLPVALRGTYIELSASFAE